jgi:hypothetical protein
MEEKVYYKCPIEECKDGIMVPQRGEYILEYKDDYFMFQDVPKHVCQTCAGELVYEKHIRNMRRQIDFETIKDEIKGGDFHE